ncbi:helical backbone metal receptor [Aneurinibacillus sp. Ricciae_BoGa-3]|uniref:helical backbone metal receptor n=1 Tax=Aneurinibacillus sp. Ricciae_BoGa-3 TaxID=3022697 RepID=UPI002341F58D|nr:helical backbone metal receptor [Aneurinibacillus sp. Ricciae_BoGa-3]WCK56215.1 helical backbone metal receptor [Aneurinibacillus sp. Ricciae_BoGa-3]
MERKTFRDSLGRSVSVLYPPQRIVSLCPSITETLYALGLGDRVVGRTRYCIHPAGRIEQATIVGGTKQISMEEMDKLEPGLIIAEKEENPKELVEELAQHYPVFVSNVENYADALGMIRELGQLTGCISQSEQMVRDTELRFTSISGFEGLRAAYLIWRKPYMAAGQNTFIHSMMQRCGFVNVFAGYNSRYPTVTYEDFAKEKPDIILLSSEPFPFGEKHQAEFAQRLPGMKTMLVDGEMFSWYGSHMKEAADYFNKLMKTIRSL